MNTTKIKLTTVQKYEDHENRDEMLLDAIVAERNGSIYIKFDQVDTNYNVTVNNLIKLKDNVVTVKRTGALSSTMVFDKEKPYATDYETPYGKLDINVKVHEITAEILQNHVNLMISYEMMMQGKKISDNIYLIESVR